MNSSCGFLILDRKGEYIDDTIDHKGNKVFGMQHHPNASKRMVVVSGRGDKFAPVQQQGRILEWIKPEFSIRDIDPVDLADFMTGLTKPQADIIRDYAYIDDFYDKLLKETQFGAADTKDWFKSFSGLFEIKDKGKKLLAKFETEAVKDERDELRIEELDELQEHLSGTKKDVLERAASRIKRFCGNPFFGNTTRGNRILNAPSCVDKVIQHLEQGHFVFLDMRGRSDDEYTLIAALFARKLLTLNKDREDENHVRACMVMEEAHNILSEDELDKGNGRGSVFIEYAREGRSFKLGFILITQQPDARSIAPQVVKTIDTVVAFAMPPDDAKHLQRLKASFTALDNEISNMKEFRGVAVSDGGALMFESIPVKPEFMESCAAGQAGSIFNSRIASDGTTEQSAPNEVDSRLERQERLAMLMRHRQELIQPIALKTLDYWNNTSEKQA